MNITMMDRLRPFLSKIIASILVPLLVWAAAKTGLAWFLDPQFVALIQDMALAWVMLAITHTGISKITNPGNTASVHLAKAEAEKAVELKAEGNTYTVKPMDDLP